VTIIGQVMIVHKLNVISIVVFMENVLLIIEINVNVMMDGSVIIVRRKHVQNYVNNVITMEIVYVQKVLLDDIVK
jgi:hypothetical protein